MTKFSYHMLPNGKQYQLLRYNETTRKWMVSEQLMLGNESMAKEYVYKLNKETKDEEKDLEQIENTIVQQQV